MTENWPEITQAAEEKRRELVLKGSDDELRMRVDHLAGLLPNSMYSLELLNFLEINSLGVRELSSDICKLKNLTQFFCRQNSLTCVPNALTTITTLKFLDMSENLIEELPVDLGKLVNLHTLNVSHNQISELPTGVSNLSCLAVLHISKNKFLEFPQELLEAPVCERLAEIYASHNEITDIPDSVESIKMLKVFDMSNNKLTELSRAIAGCLKLKQVDFTKNPLKDKRMKKLIDQQNTQKSIMDYIRTKGRAKQSSSETNGKTKGKGGRKKLKDQKALESHAVADEALVKYFLDVLKVTDDSFRVTVHSEAKEVRPFIVCCIIKGLNLDEGDKFKSFITLQTRLHDEICGKRTIATIATHDMKSLSGSYLIYDAQHPAQFKIRPLGRKGEVTALDLYQKLCKEAEDSRKEKKRNQVSGIHKYLNLLKGEEKFALIRRSSDNCVISLPPLTNCDQTKISADSSDIFVEVTGMKSLNSCKAVMDEMLKKMVELGFTSQRQTGAEKDFFDDSSDEDSTVDEGPRSLVIQQVKIEDDEGKMRVVYPSRTDLNFDTKEIKIRRPR